MVEKSRLGYQITKSSAKVVESALPLITDSSALRVVCVSVVKSTSLTFRAFPEKLERMPDIGEAVPFSDGLFHFLDRAGIHHQSYPAALGTNQVIVMLLRIEQLEVATGTIKMDSLSHL